MSGYKALLMLALPLALIRGEDFSGERALEHVKKAVEFGPRPAGSAAIRKLQAYIRQQLKTCKCEVTDDDFAARTPVGAVPMKNVIAFFPGRKEGPPVPRPTLVVTGHYDTKPMDGFVGANDGGSSTGLLLELAHVLASTPHRADIYVVWLDGEEAFREWSATDSTYGSRHLAEMWERLGTLEKIGALINVDMIGDRELDVLQETNSTATLRALARRVAVELGYGESFPNQPMAIEDDHLPFLERGVRAVDLIDFNYGPDNRWWHTREDTLDKISAKSLEIVGKVVFKMLARLDVSDRPRVIE